MNEKFANSPLVELVAEVRWREATGTDRVVTSEGDVSLQEQFFSTLTKELNEKDYINSERLIPQGFPLMEGAPVLRFKKSPANGTAEEKARELSTIIQVGVGMFTINAVQPYSCWDDFKAVILLGLNALLSTRVDSLQSRYTVSVRYINAFGESFTEGLSLREFLENKLHIGISLPSAFDDEYSAGLSQIPGIRIESPLSFGRHLTNFGQGKIKNKAAYLMENVVNLSNEIEPDADKILSQMSLARDVIHKRFFEMTKTLHSVMQLV